MEIIKKGDRVTMNENYYVSEKNKGRIFTVRSSPQMVCGTLCVWLEGYSGAYAVDGLVLAKESAESEEKK